MQNMMPMHRRLFLKTAGAFLLWRSLNPIHAQAASTPTKIERKTFATFLNVLIPADEFTGSATDLQVDKKLWELSESDQNLRRLIEVGCKWLNLTGGPPFTELTSEQQLLVVKWMSESDRNQVPRRFYNLIRVAAIQHYYSDPASWNGFAINRPPQPFGYPPPWV